MTQIANTANENKLRLAFLDGIRGFAALYVVLSHIPALLDNNLPFWLSLPTKLVRYGSFSVAIFIVLSGYCLMLPVVRSQTGYISGTLLNYFQRRARRIIPPYYVTIILCCFVTLAILTLEQFTTFRWHEYSYDWFSPRFSFLDVVLHFLLVHNLTPETQAYTINLPLWTVALEWQIYFLFPILFLPIWRRWGCLSVMTIAFIIGLIPHYLFNGFMDISRPWFVGSFTIGMVAADIAFSHKPHLIKLRKSLPWGRLTIIFTVLAISTEWQKIGVDAWIFETFASLAAACLIIHCTKVMMERRSSTFILRIFEHPWTLKLGAFSYSLYLTHGLVLTLLRHSLINLQMSATMFAIIFSVTSLAFSLSFAYLFYLVFERPFMSHLSKNFDSLNKGR